MLLDRHNSPFRKFYGHFGSCIEAFKHCRPIVSIDDIFLYGKYKHKLFIDFGIDGMNHIVPSAFRLLMKKVITTKGGVKNIYLK